MAVISKGITLSYKNGSSTTEYTKLTNLQEIPDLGGETESIEITTLADEAHMYTDGLKNYGESIDFIFLYDKEQFTTLEGLTGSSDWKVTLPDTNTCSFSGTSSIKLAGVGNGAALTYTLSVKPNSEMTWA